MTQRIVFTFGGLGFWRKLYLVTQWLGSLALAGFFLFVVIDSEESLAVPLIIVASLVLFLTYWIYTAVVERSLKQLKILVVVNFLLSNLVGSLVLISVYRHSKKELVQHGLPLS